MCTSLTLKTKDGHNFLGRTMDFSIGFNESVHFVPRNFKWSSVDLKKKNTAYALVGMSVLLNDHPVFADGVNEKGLTCATLYFPGFAEYNKSNSEDKENIAPYDFVFWALSNFENIEQVQGALKNIEIVDSPLSLLGITPPLHWILSDKSSKSIVIEKTNKGIEVFDNPIGVMTNSPNFEWHLNNLRQYIGLRPKQLEPTTWGDLNLSAFGQGSGGFGLPGDFTPPSRFVRTTYLKNTITEANNELEGVNNIFHIFSNCDIPKGAVLKSDDAIDFTFYVSAMCSQSSTYYYYTYNNRQISAVHLFNEDLNSTFIKSFPKCDNQNINFLN